MNSLADAAQHKESPKIELKRDLTKLESYATIIGILVGSGIFVVTVMVISYVIIAPLKASRLVGPEKK